MITSLRPRALIAALALTVGVLTAGCLPVTYQPPPGGNASCPQGTWTLSSESVTSLLSTFLGNATITPASSGITLALNADNSWSLTADHQSVHVVIASPSADITATVTGTASGTYTVSGSTITFTLTSLTGSVSYSGTYNGNPVSGTLSLANLGSGGNDDVEGLWALQGSASYTCNSDGTLTLTFTNFGMHLHE